MSELVAIRIDLHQEMKIALMDPLNNRCAVGDDRPTSARSDGRLR